MGSAFGSSQSGSATAQIPDELKPLVTGAVNQALALQQALPLSSFAVATPQMISSFSPYTAMGIQDSPSLTAVQPGDLGAFQAALAQPEIASQSIATPGAELAAQGILQSVVGGPIGSSPATQAGMEAWRQRVLPTVQNQAALMGLGRSGPEMRDVEQSANDAFFPLIQQEVQNRMTSLNVLSSMAAAETARGYQPRADTLQALQSQASTLTTLGSNMFDQQVQAIQSLLNSGQIQESKAQQLYDAALNDFNRLQSLSEAASLGPLGQILPSLIGSKTTSSRSPGALASVFGEK